MPDFLATALQWARAASDGGDSSGPSVDKYAAIEAWRDDSAAFVGVTCFAWTTSAGLSTLRETLTK